MPTLTMPSSPLEKVRVAEGYGTCIAMWIVHVYSKWITYVKVLFVCLVTFFCLNLFKRQIIFMKMFFHIAFKFS